MAINDEYMQKYHICMLKNVYNLIFFQQSICKHDLSNKDYKANTNISASDVTINRKKLLHIQVQGCDEH